MFYAIQATVTIVSEDWSSTRTVPTFYLNDEVQGFTSRAGLERVALDVVVSCMSEYLDTNDDDDVTVSIAWADIDDRTDGAAVLDARTGQAV